MKVLLRLFNTEEKAADGSVIPRSVVEEYLRSDDYKKIIADKIALGGVTHKDRGGQQLEKYESIGEDDPILITDNVTHYITKVFFKDASDPICYGEIELFNPDDFSGKRKDNIMNLEGMLKSGSYLPISIVIQAMWSSQEKAEKIIRLKGLDFTLNPSFPSAGVVKVYSKLGMNNVVTLSTKSDSDKSEKVKVFSSTIIPELPMEPSKTKMTEKEYRLKYGIKNGQYDPTREFEYEKDTPEDISVDRELSDKKFSYSMPAIEARMRMIYLDPKNLFRRIIRNYKQYYKLNPNLNEKEMKYLQLIFMQDVNYLIRLQLKNLMNGGNISNRLGLSFLGRDIQKIGYILGINYRRALVSEKKLGFIPKNIYNAWVNSLGDFYNALSDYIFDNSIVFDDYRLTSMKTFSGYADIGTKLDEQNDYKSIDNPNGGKLGGINFLTLIDPAFGIGKEFQNYFCHE